MKRWQDTVPDDKVIRQYVFLLLIQRYKYVQENLKDIKKVFFLQQSINKGKYYGDFFLSTFFFTMFTEKPQRLKKKNHKGKTNRVIQNKRQ